MILIVNVWLFLIGVFIVPTPPIQPFWPQPQQLLHVVGQHRIPRRGPLANGSNEPQPIFVANPAPAHQENNEENTDRMVIYQRVAARSLGEGSFALAEIACTIKNRLRVSRASLTAVLRAYHAADVPPSPAHIEIVRQVFEGQLPCPETWWYALSLQDTYTWRPHQRPPVKTIQQNERKQILIFDR